MKPHLHYIKVLTKGVVVSGAIEGAGRLVLGIGIQLLQSVALLRFREAQCDALQVKRRRRGSVAGAGVAAIFAAFTVWWEQST